MAQVEGVLSLNEIDILEVDGDPIIAGGTPSAIGSISINKNNGDIYSKYGTLDTEWKLVIEVSNSNVDGGSPSTNYDASIAIDGGGV